MLSSGGEGILLKISLHLLVTVNNADWWVIIGISVTVKWQQLETATRRTCELYIVYTHLFNLVLRDVHRQLGKHITWHHLVDWDLGSNKTARAHPENKFGGAISLPLFSPSLLFSLPHSYLSSPYIPLSILVLSLSSPKYSYAVWGALNYPSGSRRSTTTKHTLEQNWSICHKEIGLSTELWKRITKQYQKFTSVFIYILHSLLCIFKLTDSIFRPPDIYVGGHILPGILSFFFLFFAA